MNSLILLGATERPEAEKVTRDPVSMGMDGTPRQTLGKSYKIQGIAQDP